MTPDPRLWRAVRVALLPSLAVWAAVAAAVWMVLR
jgi:hypothetical protein